MTEFKKHLPDVRIIGTDLYPDPAATEKIEKHDFHILKPEWEFSFDFVYSNSLDHSYNPQLAVYVWMESLKPEGRLFLGWYASHGEKGLNQRKGDIFGQA